MAEAPKDKSNDSSRVPSDISSMDFLSSHGFTSEEQSKVSEKAGKPSQTFNWGPNMFDKVPCRDCSGSLRVHDDTCVKHPKRTAIEAVEDPNAGFENLHFKENKK